jgi:hypothetical protein
MRTSLRYSALFIGINSLTLLAACAPSKSKCTASVEINKNNPSVKGECTWEIQGGRIAQTTALKDVLGETLGEFAFNHLPDGLVAQVQPFNPATFDMSLAKMSTQGTTATIDGNSGTFVAKLYFGSQLLAAKSFDWIRNGADIIAANPAAVNTWIAGYRNADGFEYGGTVKFDGGAAKSVAVYTTHSYNGRPVLSTTNSFARPLTAKTLDQEF